MLHPAEGRDVYDTGRLPVPAPLDLVVRYYWWVTWRRPVATSFEQRVLSHPVTHLTVEDADGGRLHGLDVPGTLLHGVVTRVFTVELPPAGRVAAVAFQPGGLAALLGTDVRHLTDRVVPAGAVLGPWCDDLGRDVLAVTDEARRRDLVAAHLGHVLEARLDAVREDAAYRLVREAVRLMRDRELVAVADVAERLAVSPRTLQRWFARYVGVSPLWVLRRYRLQDAAAAIDAGQGHDLAGLATSLGFADHAHLARAFTAVVGVPPSRYRDG